MAKKLKERNELIVKLYKDGLKQAEIARRLNMFRQRIHQILKAEKVINRGTIDKNSVKE